MLLLSFKKSHPAIIYSLKINSRNTRKSCEICLKVTIKHYNDVNGRQIVKGKFHLTAA